MCEGFKRETLLSGLVCSTAKITKEIGRPYRDGDVRIQLREVWTMDDGLEIELCLWSESELLFLDLSAEKTAFDRSGKQDFPEYLRAKGLPQEDAEDRYGRWKYCGVIPKETVYRVQFHWTGSD